MMVLPSTRLNVAGRGRHSADDALAAELAAGKTVRDAATAAGVAERTAFRRLGEQGSAKTTTGRVLKRLIDPSAAPLRSEPKDTRDLMIAARHAHVIGLDNLSYLPGWLSDSLCRLATGGGFATRELYANDDEVIFDSKRPSVLTGIEDFVSRGPVGTVDLVASPANPGRAPKAGMELWAAFDVAHPKLLGALSDRVSAGLRALPGQRLDRLPRMADFALFAAACEDGMGEEPRFLAAYYGNQAGACEQALNASPLPAALVKLMEGRDRWAGTPAELLDALTATSARPQQVEQLSYATAARR